MADERPQGNQLVRMIVDYGGLGAWLVAFFVGWLALHQTTTVALVTASWWLAGGSAAALALGLIVERRVAPLPLFAGAVAVIFGGLTIALHDPRFVKMKPTIINAGLAVAMFAGAALRKNPLKALLSGTLNLSEAAWRKLTFRYGVFFAAMAVLNEVIWRTQPDAVWVLFHFPGFQVLAVLFAFTQLPMMMKDLKAVEAAAELEP